MRVLVVGAGAVGSFLGATLAAGGCEVMLVDKPDAGALGAEELAGHGRGSEPGEPLSFASTMVVVEHRGERPAVRVRQVRSVDEIDDQPDVALVASKVFDVGAAIRPLERWPSIPVLTVQNGIGAEDTACATHRGPVVAGSLTTAVELAAPGRVLRRRRGGIGLAVARGDGGAAVEALIGAFTRGGLVARRFDDAVAMKWSKLLGNVVGNATSAILDFEPAAVYADARLFAVERVQILECLGVMAALGRRPVALPGADARLVALAFRLPPWLGRLAMSRVAGGARGGKWPSLAIHVRSGRGLPTEAPWLNGAVARTGESVAAPAPVNGVLARLVDEVASDAERRRWFRGRPDRLLAEVRAVSSA